MITFTRCAFIAKQACATFSQVVQKITPPIANNFLKFFFALFATLTLNAATAWGAEVEFLPGDFSGQGTSGTGSAISATENGVTFACDKGYGTTQFRCYSGGKITISSSNTITAISFTFSGSYKGGLESSYTNLDTKFWEKALSSQARITKCVVTYEEASTDPYTVTFHTTATSETELTEDAAGAGVTPPTMEKECGDWTFQGWSKLYSDSETSTTELELVTLTDKKYYPTEDVNLYPVYTQTTSTGGTAFDKYTQVSLGGTITSGKYLISTGLYTMAGNGKTGVSFSPGSTEKTAYEYTITIDGSYFTIKGPDEKYVGGGSSTTLTFNASVQNDTYRWSYVEAGIQNKTHTTRRIRANGSTDFRHYANSNGTTTYLYKRTEKSSGSTYYYSYPQCATQTVVTLNPNEGTGGTTEVTATYGQPMPAITIPTRTGYDFQGYFTENGGAGTKYYNADGTSAKDWDKEDATFTLYAYWIAKTYTVTLDNQGATTAGATSVTATYNAAMPSIASNLPDKTGYTFNGYFDATSGGTKYYNADGTSAKNWDKTANTTLYAQWTSNKTATSLSWSAATYSATIDADNTFPELTKSPADLTGITYSSLDETVATIDANGNITLLKKGETTITATFEETATHTGATASYTLTVHSSNCRWVETEIGDIDSGDEVVIAMEKEGHFYALDYSNENKDYPPATKISVIGNEITGTIAEAIQWNISGNATNGYIIYPNGTTDTWLFCSKSYVRIGTNSNKVFTIENGYLKRTNLEETWSKYVGVSISTSSWRHYDNTTSVIKDQTLKFYKKTCLPADEYWINYNLSNVTCITNPKPISVNSSDSELRIFFEPVDGYQLPKEIEVKMGEQILNEELYTWDNTNGKFVIESKDISFVGDVTISIIACKSMDNPADLRTNVTSTTATLSWSTVENAQNYTLLVISDDDDISYSYETTLLETTCLIEGLTPNTTYLWEVVANGVDGYCDTHTDDIFTTLDVYTVTFNSNGGTAVESQPVDHGSKATKPANPTKTGYTFAGWYTEADTEFDFNTPITSPTAIYAKWNANQYTITFLKQWGDGGTETATVHFNNNDFSVNPIIVPTCNGYTFGGYYTAESGAGTQLIDVSGAWLNAPTYIEGGKWVYADNLKLYAKWTQNFTITWMANGQPYHTQTAMMGTAIAKPDDPDANEFACDDKVFVGWLDKTISGSTNEEPTFVTDFGTIQANKTYYAVFAKLTGTPSNDYNKITDINDLTDGEYVIAYGYDTSSPSIILKAEAKDATKLAATSATPTNNKYTSPAAANIWEIKKNGDNYSIYNAATQKYVEATTTPSVGLSDNPEYYTISWNSSYSYWKIQIADFTNYWFVGYIAGETKYFQSYNVTNNKYRIQLYKNASTAVYSDYVTTCVEIPTPHWEGAEIDNADIAVDCGAISFKSNASKITFDKNYDLTYPITLTASEGFLLSTNKQNDVYEQSVTVTPVQSGDNKGKITQSVYVRADATDKNTNFDGTITISGDQLAEDQIIEVHAVVDCPQYTLTFNDCGDTKTITDFAGTSVEEKESWAETCSEPFQYVFDGWATAPVANGTEEYEKVDFSTFTMPNNNTTILYAVYRYAEEGGEPVNGYVKVTEALADWSGDYVIVNETAKKAIGNAYNNNNNNTLTAIDVAIENDKVVSPSENVIWQIRKSGSWYTMYNATAEKYAYITENKSEAAGLDNKSQNLSISFNNGIVKIYGETITRCFSYYSTNTEWRTYSTQTYSTGALYRLAEKTIRYTSSLICGSITAEDALVTSTKDQKVKVKVPIMLESSTGATTINATSDNAAFDVTGLTDVEEGDHTIVIEYTPVEYNITETANITLFATNGATATFTVSGRSLPENFVIATKVGATWYALPANMNGATNPEGIVIDVDETTMTATAPNTTVYTLFPVATINGNSDRYKEYGERLRFAAVNNGNKGLWANNADNGTKINNDAAITAANSTAGAAYEWKITTTIVDGNWQYTLQTDQDKNQQYLRYWVGATGAPKWGTYAAGNNQLYFLPVTETEPFDYKVVEWYPTKMLIQTDATIANPTAEIGDAPINNVTCTNKGSKLYEIAGLPLESNPTKVLTIKFSDGGNNYTNATAIPVIISQSATTVSSAPFTTLTKDVYNYADLVVRDGATLTIDGETHAENTFFNVTIYPTSKISVPSDKKLTVHSLTFFGGIDDIYDGEKYTTNKYGVPQLSLKGTLGKTVTTMDYIMRVNLDQMYQVGVPYNVDLRDVTYWDGSAIELGDELYVSAYDGQARANLDMSNTWRWEVNFAEKVLKAGVGYTISAEPQVENDDYSILRMPMKDNIASGNTEESKQVPVIAYANQHSVQIADNHKGWNYLSNPYMTAISGGEADSELVLGYLKETGTGPWEWVNDEIRYVTIPHDDGEDYYQKKFSEAVLKPFKSFFVQIATNGDLSFALTSRQNAPARYMEVQTEQEVEFEILLSNDKQSDNTGLLIAEQYSPAYEINADLEKMIGSMSVYTIYGGYNLAYNAISPINASEWIPMGYIAPAAGEYTFRLDDIDKIVEQVEHVYLIDYDANNIVDLMDDEYEFTTDKEQNNNRFAINIVLIQDKDNTTTGMDIINGNVAAPIKFIYHDKMYIQSGGVIYDGTGKQVININK